MSAGPSIYRLLYQNGVIQLNWTMPGAGSTTTFQVTIQNVSTGATTPYPATGLSAKIQQQLDAGTAYNATVTTSDGSQSSAAVPIITVSPQVTLVQNTGNGLLLNWNTVGTYTRYSAVLQQQGQLGQTQTVNGTSCEFSTPLNGSGWSASVAAQTSDGISTGPVGQTYSPILVAPTVTQVQNTGSGLQLEWTLLGYTMFQVFLQAGGGTPTSQPVTGTSYTFSGALTGSAYSTWVCAQSTDGVLVGPPSIEYAPILQQVTMTAVENTGVGAKLNWQQLGTYTYYRATLQQIGNSSVSNTVKALTCTFNQTMQGAGWSTTVAAQSADGICIGPPSTQYSLITDQPSLTMLDYVTSQLGVTWQQVSDPSVTGYVLQVIPAGSQPTIQPVGNVSTYNLPMTLTPPTVYSALVRASNGIVLGPWSAAVVPLIAAPTLMRLGYDGTHLIANWQAPTQSGVTGYIVTLYAGVGAEETQTPRQTSQQFQCGFVEATVFTAAARATNANARGPWSAAATGPYLAQLTFAYDYAGRLQSVAWANAKTQTYALDAPGNIQSVTFTDT